MMPSASTPWPTPCSGVRNRSGKLWSGHTISRILGNPAYAGHICYGEVYVENAHEPLISRQTWRAALAIAAARADEHSQRAASPADYHLTGLISCPDCGHKYVGTSATGLPAPTGTTPASPAPVTAPAAARPRGCLPTKPTPPSCRPSATSTPAPLA